MIVLVPQGNVLEYCHNLSYYSVVYCQSQVAYLNRLICHELRATIRCQRCHCEFPSDNTVLFCPMNDGKTTKWHRWQCTWLYGNTCFSFSWRWQHLPVHPTTPVIAAAIFGSAFCMLMNTRANRWNTWKKQNKTQTFLGLQDEFVKCSLIHVTSDPFRYNTQSTITQQYYTMQWPKGDSCLRCIGKPKKSKHMLDNSLTHIYDFLNFLNFLFFSILLVLKVHLPNRWHSV